MGLRFPTTLLACVIACASGTAQDKATAARELFARLDMTRPEMREVAALVAGGELGRALDLWRDGVVMRLRERDFGEYGWHGYVLHPRPGGAADHLAGKTSRDDYLTSGMVGFVDIYGMAGAPGAVGKINWAVDINGPIDWGTPELAALDKGAKLLKADYANFEFAKAFVGKYWQTDDGVYLLKAFEIMGDFARNSRRGFWADYHAKGIGDTEVREIYRTDWRLNTNGLGMGWRAKNFIKIMAGLAKSLSGDKPASWNDILRPLDGRPTRDELDRVPSARLAEVAISLVEDHSGKLLWFCLGSGAVPNQRSEGLRSLAFMSVIFPNFKKTPQLVEVINRGYEDMLTGNFLPDGGSLEQSFNYNVQDKEGLEELVRFFGDEPPSYAQLALAKVRARRAVDDGLQTPLGGLPQVGNHHDILGKDVWSSDETAAQYWASEAIHGREPVRRQGYTSKAYRYSGFFAMRGGWEMDDPYLFFMAGRPQRGHSMRDNNAIQMTAFGRQLVVCGGPPTYGNFRNEDARGADFYLSEASSLKCNTVIVDGNSQSRDGPKVARGYETPVDSRWHTSGRYDVVDGSYGLGYGKFEDGRDVEIDKLVDHYRQVIFVRDAGLWVILDRMSNKGDAEHEYTQLWNFLPRVDDENWEKRIAGFGEDQFALDEDAKLLRTTDLSGPNVEFRHFGPERVTYTRYFGDRERWLGWFAAGIGDAQPAVDVHVGWTSDDSDSLVTVMSPMDVGQDSPVAEATEIDGGVDVALREGGRIQYLAAAEATELEAGPVRATAQALLVQTGATGEVAGIVVGCEGLEVDGKTVDIDAPDFEFALRDGAVELTPSPRPEAAVADEYEPRPWVLREPDLALDAELEGGLTYELFRFEKSIRLYDLMLKEVVQRGTSEDCSLEPWADERSYGLKWTGYLRVPADGMYRFRCHSPTGARLFIMDPERDLELPPVVYASYRQVDAEGAAALKAGHHRLAIHYIQAWNNPNELEIEIEGPGADRQPLTGEWLFRDPT